MELEYLYLGYGIAFLMAFLSMLIELSNKYGAYFQFTAKSLYSFLYCGAYGLVGFFGFWLYQSGISSNFEGLDGANNIEQPLIRTAITAIIIGWSAKGLVDAPILPSGRNDENNEGFRFKVLINFIFLNADNRFDNIIAKKQRSYFDKSIKAFSASVPANKNAKQEFERKVYGYLEFHRSYGGGDASAVAKFNTFLSELAKQTTIESSFRFAYRNLGYHIFKAILN